MKILILILLLLSLALFLSCEEQDIIYHGNIETRVFHKPSCRYYNCDNCTAVFTSREEAINAGYTPCQVCNP